MEKSVPLWLEISRKIEAEIDSGVYSAGDILPNEYQLCEIYSVSRITVRSALARLKDLGKIKRVKGKGTIVLHEKIEEPLLKITGFSDEMKEKGIVPSTSYAHICRKKVSGYIAELFEQSSSTYFTVLERVDASIPFRWDFLLHISRKALVCLMTAGNIFLRFMKNLRMRSESGSIMSGRPLLPKLRTAKQEKCSVCTLAKPLW